MLTDEIAATVTVFFDGGKGPSHDELDRAIARAGLKQADPGRQQDGEVVGKVKRLRAVFSYALEHDRETGGRLVLSLIGQLKADGAFRPSWPTYAGLAAIEALREALQSQGYALDADGNVSALVIDDLESPEATEALRLYVKRAQRGERDAALLVGTGKDLIEATARHVLVRRTGSYPTGESFGATLYAAFDRLGLRAAHNLEQQLDAEPVAAVQQALYLLAVAVNRLRNVEGTGHGRPFPPKVSDADARLAVEAMGLVSEMLLRLLERAPSDGRRR